MKQAKIDLSYCRGILESSPILSKLIAGITANSIELATGVVIECGVANYSRSAAGAYASRSSMRFCRQRIVHSLTRKR